MKKIWTIVMFVLAGSGLWFWLSQRGRLEEARTEPSVVATVEVTPLTEREIAETAEVFGVVAAAPSSEQVAAAKFDGVVKRVAVVVGSRVAAGDLLVELEAAPETQLAFASARGAAALAEKARADTQRRFDLNLATRPELQSAEQAAQDAQLKVTSLQARGVGGDGRVLAAAAGVVSKVELASGTWVSAGAALVTVTTEAMDFRLGVEPSDASKVTAGQTVKLRSANRPDTEPVVATVREVGHILDATSGSVEVRVALPSGTPFLLGEHVRATIELRKKTALVAPRSALLNLEDHQVIYTVVGGKAVRHEVHVGVTTTEWVEISGVDLHVGEPVVALGNYELEDGMAVRIGGPVDPAKPTTPAKAVSEEAQGP